MRFATPSAKLLGAVRCCPYCNAIFTKRVDFCGVDGRRLIERDDDPLVGFDIDRYQVLGRIAAGASGAVYRVQHGALGRMHAMKVLYGDLAQNRKIAERFRREAKAIAKIEHPNIVYVADLGTTANGLIYMVMDLIEGATLRSVIDQHAPLSYARVAQLGAQMAAGLAEVHRHGFVHRDVKPSNMMVSREKNRELLRILDFGVVGNNGPQATETQITSAGHLVGTPLYMAPEQARNPSEVTAAADVYSLGILLYEMITGSPPFDAAKTVEVILRHTSEPPRPLPECGGLEELIPWMLEKDPLARPDSHDLEQELILISESLPETEPALPLSRATIDRLELELAFEEPVTFPGV